MTSNSPARDRLVAALLCFGLSTPVAAQEGTPAPEPPAPAPEASVPAPEASEPAPAPEAIPVADPEITPAGPGEEMIIYSEREVIRLRQELSAAIQAEGYKEGKRRGDQTLYRPLTPWKPTVVVHEDGLLTLQRSPVRVVAPGRPDNALNYLWCLPPFTPMCVRIGGQVVSESKLDAAKGRVADTVHEPSERWRRALISQSMQNRIDQELPARLDRMWVAGHPLEGEGPALLSIDQRRQAILAYWASRADTPEGHLVAGAIEAFIEGVIQVSGSPVQPAEEAEANALAGGVRRLQLGAPSAAPPGEPPPG